MKKILFFICLIISHLYMFSQEIDYINTDRPDHSEGAYTMTKNNFQFENGLVFSSKTFSDDLMLRYGLFDGTEIRLESVFEKIKLNELTFSFKQRIVEERKMLPAITFVGALSYDFMDKKTNSDICFAFENTLSEQFTLAYNLGSSDGFQRLFTAIELGFSPSSNTFLFAEYYAHFGDKVLPSHNIDTGFLYYFNEDLQIDFAVGKSFSNGKDLFFTIGFSCRIKKL